MSKDASGEAEKLRIVLGDYPHSLPLKKGEITSPRLALDFVDIKPTNRAFKPMVRELQFDVCEMAIVTYLQAKAYGKKLILLPAVMLGRFQHQHIHYDVEHGPVTPADLPGKRVGVRAYTQTTGAWLRGILQNDYGVDLSRVHWVTFEDAHVAEYEDPPGIERAPAEKNLVDMLFAGELDAVIAELPPNPRLRPVIPDPQAAAKQWYERHHVAPINHMVVVKEALARAKPWVVQEVFGLLLKAKQQARAAAPAGFDATPFGVEANRKALELIINYAVQQKLIPHRFEVDELFDELTRGLGA
jgi:4,5-dihydroxyphthalate decarboxylase